MAFNRQKAIEDFSKIQVSANEEGLIHAFGVLLQKLPSNLWNKFSIKMIKEAIRKDLYDEAAWLLSNAATECGYHTGWGIINSEEFKAVVEPMVNTVEDRLLGVYAAVTAWGWANSDITEIIPGKKLVVKAIDYYEADIAIAEKLNRPFAFMLGGISAAFMDIAYGQYPYPYGFGTFKYVQTKGLEMGDLYGEIVVTRI